ncbi:MAG: Cna B-type domain-containing protein, partial [Oscillospiraceae bacterium]|nr:Cna B-type domain-containing protein [Oscillospiraceae bacterium]
VWSSTPPADLSQVTAVAIDASKRTDGSDFELEPDETLMVYLHMMAPSGTSAEQYLTDEGTDPAQNAHAFNNLYLDARQSVMGKVTQAYINYNYTKIGIYTHSIQVEKVWDDQNDNDAMRPTFVTVHLLADGEDTGLTLTLNEENQWKGEFKHLKTYNNDGSYITYTFTEDPVEGYTLRIERDGDTVRLTNHHDLIQTEYPVTKVWQDDDTVRDRTRPEYITLRLYANDIVTDEPVFTGRVLTVRPDDEGQWAAAFTGLNKYDRGHEIVYSVKEDMVTDYITTYSEEGNEITNRYYPYGDLIISKTVVNGTDAALEKDFTVVLELTTPDGEGVIDRYSYETSDGRTGRVGNGGELTLKHGQTVTVKDIPSGVRYRVTEVSRAGFELTGSVNTTGIIRSDQPCKAELTNTYSSRGAAQLSAHKTLTGHAMTRYQFQFRIEDQDHQQLTTANNQANGDVQFGYLRYTEANDGQTYTYYVAEVDKGRPGYTYDSTVYRVEITPHDKGDGTMDCEVVRYDSQDDPVDTLEFANEYHASGSIELRAWTSL